MTSKYDYMTKEQLVEELKQRNKKVYAWKKSISLPVKEGEYLEKEILPKYNCENLNQLIKKIVKGELILSFPEND